MQIFGSISTLRASANLRSARNKSNASVKVAPATPPGALATLLRLNRPWTDLFQLYLCSYLGKSLIESPNLN